MVVLKLEIDMDQLEQTMSSVEAQRRIDLAADGYCKKFLSGEWTLFDAHENLCHSYADLDLFQIAGLAKAIACFQCSADNE